MGDCACHANDLHLRWNGADLAFLFLELTPACNNRCPGCSNVFTTRRVEAPLSGGEWIDLIERIQPRVRWLKLTGGEPTLHPEFGKIVTFLNQSGIPFRLLTNGRWPNFSQTLALLVESPMLESLLISLHGPDNQSHEAFTGVPGSFDDAVSAVSHAAEAQLKAATSTVITRYNWNRVEEIAQFASSRGADHVAFNRYIGPPLPDLEATAEQGISALREVEHLISQGAQIRFGTPVPQCLFPNSTMPCLAGRAFITVDPWGRVRPCNHAPLIVGNLFQDSLEGILPRLVKWHTGIPEVCNNCNLREVCGAGCRAETMLREDVLQDSLKPETSHAIPLEYTIRSVLSSFS
jgi:radical SAM protein with 4Fe4S-binding SPASM domain